MAIDEKINEGVLKLHTFIGETAENLVSARGTVFHHMEGCICNFK